MPLSRSEVKDHRGLLDQGLLDSFRVADFLCKSALHLRSIIWRTGMPEGTHDSVGVIFSGTIPSAPLADETEKVRPPGLSENAD